MKVVSTNLGKERTIHWKNKTYQTGIFKKPVDRPIFLESRGVQGDHINNLKVHGGIDKACYAYGENYYNYWKEKYPYLEWTFGMFGENLTISELNEDEIKIGDVYKLGGAVIQVSQPRQPCSKFAAKFESVELIKQFIEYDHPGVYFRVIQPGEVKAGDELYLDLRNDKALTVQQIYQLLYSKMDKVNKELAELAVFDSNLSKSSKETILRLWNL
ncbi:MAG: MOSC domain-containing protein [Cytophagales bacterium]|nr:MOSC domain-containing protein [Cytophagales bacterium]